MRALLATAAVLAACGPKAAFRLTTPDNDGAALASALARRQLPGQPSPVNAAARPRVFALEAGAPRTIVAYDLGLGRTLWTQAADVRSRIWVGGDFVVEEEGSDLVARDQQQGAVRWRVAVHGVLVGAAADRDRAYVVWQENATNPLAAYEGASGKRRWQAKADGQLGAPAAQGGLVYVPYLNQWLSLVDGRTGELITRLRGIDDQIGMLRATSQALYYGSRRGVYLLDARAASGTRAGSTFGTAAIPPELSLASYGRDMYDPVQLGYTAADRTRVVWTGTLGAYAIHYFRYVFGFDAAGALSWAYAQPDVELVASDDTGPVIAAVSQAGDLVALDPASGAVRYRGTLGTKQAVLGATFDADGWAPTSAHEPERTVAVLAEIARDRDARFDAVKELAVAELAKRPGAEVARDLLAILPDPRAPQLLKDRVLALLVSRKDPASLPALAAQVDVHVDYIHKTEPEELGAVARAIAGLAGEQLDPAAVTQAVDALREQLDDPSTQVPDLVAVIDAMAAIGGERAQRALGSHLLLYHTDDELGQNALWQKAIVGALVVHGGPEQRELLRQVAADPRTRPGLAAAIHAALEGSG